MPRTLQGMDIYTDPAPQTAITPAPSATSAAAQATADSLYPAAKAPAIDRAPNAAVQAVRDADSTARTLYPPEKQYGKALDEIAVSINPAGTREQLEAGKVAFAAVAQDVGLSTDQIAQMSATAKALRSSPPTPAQIDAMNLEAYTALRETWGDRADEALNNAKLLVQRDGRLARFLEHTGLGNDPTTVLLMCDLARRARARGQLN
jgi:hypothetical protein